MPALSAVVARTIAAERARRGWRQSDLADKLGISRSQAGHLEQGVRGIPLDLLPKLCEVFGLSLAELFGQADAADRRRMRL